MSGCQRRCRILQHDLDVKRRKIDEFLEKGFRVTVSATYEVKRNAWKDEYPKAIEASKGGCRRDGAGGVRSA